MQTQQNTPLSHEASAFQKYQPESIPAKRLIWKSAGDTDEIFLVQSGAVKIVTKFDNYKTLELLYSGAFFGGMVFLGVREARVEAYAACDAKVLRLKRDEVERMLVENPALIGQYLATISLYVSHLKRRSGENSHLSLRTRLVNALKKDLEARRQLIENRPAISRILLHDEWGQLLGARRESVSRIFSDLEKDGCVRIEDQHIVFLKDDWQ